jgi:hypothetical protein
MTSFRISIATAAIAVGPMAGASLPAAAQVGVAVQHSRAGREHAQLYRAFNYAPVSPAATYRPPDY